MRNTMNSRENMLGSSPQRAGLSMRQFLWLTGAALLAGCQTAQPSTPVPTAKPRLALQLHPSLSAKQSSWCRPVGSRCASGPRASHFRHVHPSMAQGARRTRSPSLPR
jgi:hypothetical protein